MPANNTDLCYLTIAEAAPLLRDKMGTVIL